MDSTSADGAILRAGVRSGRPAFAFGVGHAVRHFSILGVRVDGIGVDCFPHVQERCKREVAARRTRIRPGAMGATEKSAIRSLCVFVLAVLFYAFFMHAKHDPALSKVNVFADDPYDAVGSFGIQAAALLAILCVVREFRRRGSAAGSADEKEFLLRAQAAAILPVGVTLAADAVAMIRHPFLWFGLPAGYRLLALIGGMAILTAAIGFWIRHAAAAESWRISSRDSMRAVIVSIGAALALVFYPESFRRGLIGVLFTALVGTVILFMATWAWTMALVPNNGRDNGGAVRVQKVSGAREGQRRKYHWVIVVLVGVLIGLFFVAGEAAEGSGIPRAKLALVISAYIGLETAGLIVGYAFLGESLGLFRRRSQ